MPAPDTLRTERLVCTRFTIENAVELARIDTDPAVQATIFGITYSAAETYARTQRRVTGWTEFGYGDYVVRRHDGEFVGCAGIFPAHRPGAIAIGYALLPPFWGLGYATELAVALAATAALLKPEAVVATVLETNLASRRVVEKAGFISTGPDPDDPGTILYEYRA